MIQLDTPILSPQADKQLRKYQQKIDQIADYAQRVAAAKTEFSKRNKNTSKTFQKVRKALTTMCSGARRCCYCEDSVADEVEHIYPKDLYPEKVFIWKNYLYACGPCNGPKNNNFAVIDPVSGNLIEVSRLRDAPITPPHPGLSALIDPRFEDPLNFLELDLLFTFFFVPRAGLSAVDRLKADYTRKILHLNDRDYLVEARMNAYSGYRARLVEYIVRRNKGASPDQLTPLISAVQHSNHPTVWREMQRQHYLIVELQSLFAQAPEALTW